jgi:cytosine/adenosine deaminase-related metal-dependent hydrolase
MTPAKFAKTAALLALFTATPALAIGLGAPRLKPPPQTDAVISDVTVLNPGVSRAARQTIVLKAGRIADVRPWRPSDPPAICPGCIAMPGLIDAHVHNPPKLAFGNQELFALLHLAHGVTTVRDVGESDDSVVGLAKRLNTGRLIGPSMLRCGRVLESAPLSFGAAQAVETEAEGRAAVADLARSGVNCIKVYNNLRPAPYAGIRAEAEARGIPVIGHVPHQVGLAKTFDFEAQHFTGVPYVRGGPTPPHSDYTDADWISMTETEIGAALDLAKINRVSFLPTLANGRLRLISSDPTRFPPTPAAAYLPQIWTRAWASQTMIASHPTGAGVAAREDRLPILMRVTRMARERGVDVLAGTDTMMPWVVPGESLLLEIDDLAVGFGDREAALAAATTVNGRHIAPGVAGVIAPGARADVLLLPEDPSQDLTALRKWTILFAHGRRYNRATVEGWLERYKAHFQSPIYAFVMNLAAGPAAAGKGREDDHGH